MSLLEVRGDRRSRSKSPGGGRDRDRSRSHSRDNRRDSPDRSEYKRSSRKYVPSEAESGSDSGHRSRHEVKRSSKKYHDDEEEEEEEEDIRPRSKSSKKYADESDDEYKYRMSSSRSGRDISASEDDRSSYARPSNKKSDSDSDRRREKDRSERERRTRYEHSGESASEDERRGKYSSKVESGGRDSSHRGYDDARPQTSRHGGYVSSDPRYAPAPGRAPSPPPTQRMHSYGGAIDQKYADVEQFKYAQPAAYSDKREYERARPEPQRRGDDHDHKGEKYSQDRYETREPKNKKYYDDDDQYEERKPRKHHDDKYGSPPDHVTRKMSSLAVAGAAGAATLGVAGMASHSGGGGGGGGGRPPASPLLEAYKGTYQSISPMPSALVLANHKDDSDLSDLDLELDGDSDDPNADLKRKIRKLEREKEMYAAKESRKRTGVLEPAEIRPRRSSKLEAVTETTTMEIREPGGPPRRERATSSVSILSSGGGRPKKSVSFYDPTDDARRITAALSGTRSAPDPRPLLQILPFLSTDDLIALRAEYKKHAKVNGQGINMAKHIKMRIPGNLGKAAYATALGRWESEAYWANSWYQGGASRRELLIESLMGRSNSDIREIKNCFKDKKYHDDLEKCIRTELRADKFRTAILLALEERRMPESTPVDIGRVREDVDDLARALSGAGGESDMINVVVVRSDAHLREVLRLFERTYRRNFARDMIAKSRNLVGETLAHILNGALNRPMRDALLLHQAISETAPGKERTELLISRLVRLHWEPKHLAKVKAVFRDRYGRPVEESVKRDVWAGMKTPEGRLCAEFCIALAQSGSGSNEDGPRGVVSDVHEEYLSR